MDAKDASEVIYSEVNIYGEAALFTTQQFDPATTPRGLHSAVLPHGMGMLLSLTPFPAAPDGISYVQPRDIHLCAGEIHTVDQFLQTYRRE